MVLLPTFGRPTIPQFKDMAQQSFVCSRAPDQRSPADLKPVCPARDNCGGEKRMILRRGQAECVLILLCLIFHSNPGDCSMTQLFAIHSALQSCRVPIG